MLSDQTLLKVGQGNWKAFQQSHLKFDEVFDIAKDWAPPLAGVQKPWLCWNIDDDWCLAQQRLAVSAGWTPIIGFDPRVGPPRKTVPNAVVIDFNQHLRLPILYPHFVMEFAFAFSDRLAFWHSDLLVRVPLLEDIARKFDGIADGETIVTKSPAGLLRRLQPRKRRYWELIGCTTREASRQQFASGAGWWMAFYNHPNCPNEAERQRRQQNYYWDHGTGVYYWHKECGGRVSIIKNKKIHEGHCTKIGNKKYQRSVPVNSCDAGRSMSSELTRNFDLHEVAKRMSIAHVIL